MHNWKSSIDHGMQPDDCQCGFGRTYLVNYRMYDKVPQKLIFFRKNPPKKRLCLWMWEWPNLFSLIKSIFVGQKRLCHWSNLLDDYKITFHFKTGSCSYYYIILNILVMLTSKYMMSQCSAFNACLKLCYTCLYHSPTFLFLYIYYKCYIL